MNLKHDLLLRQLHRCGLSGAIIPKDMVAWTDFLTRVNNSYMEADQERYTLERSQEISSKEMQDLYEDAQKMTEDKIVLARQAGMAEVASSVLHNIGNVLNSVNTTSGLVIEKLEMSEIKNLNKLIELLNEQGDNLAEFFKTDPRSKNFLNYLNLLGKQWELDKSTLTKELAELNENIQHIKDIITAQQSLTGALSFKEPLSLHEILDTALNICRDAIEQRGIRFMRDYSETEPQLLEKSKLLQIIVNLLKNAQDAFQNSTLADKQIILRGRMDDNKQLVIQVVDNGEGIAPENLEKIFSYGFTTKTNGHGYGLHNSALAAKEMGGSLSVKSEGVGCGATFTLEIG